MASNLDVNDPILSQKWKGPQTYEEVTKQEHFQGNVEDFYWPVYYEALDLVINSIQKHLELPGY